jgi:hypothetical protein
MRISTVFNSARVEERFKVQLTAWTTWRYSVWQRHGRVDTPPVTGRTVVHDAVKCGADGRGVASVRTTGGARPGSWRE